MSMIKCPECGKEISDSVKRCPNCAYKLKRTNKRKIVIIVAILVVVSIVAGLGYVYIKNNTCILGHDWKKATCEKPKQCTRCKEKSGEPLGHDWDEATCEKPSICKRCKQQNGVVLGHTTRIGYCDRCGKYVDELYDVLESFNNTIKETYDMVQNSLDTMALTDSFYDTSYISQANQIDYEIQDKLFEASKQAYQYPEFSKVAYYFEVAGAKIYLYDDLDKNTGFGSFVYETNMAQSLTACVDSLNEAQSLLNDMSKKQ